MKALSVLAIILSVVAIALSAWALNASTHGSIIGSSGIGISKVSVNGSAVTLYLTNGDFYNLQGR